MERRYEVLLEQMPAQAEVSSELMQVLLKEARGIHRGVREVACPA